MSAKLKVYYDPWQDGAGDARSARAVRDWIVHHEKNRSRGVDTVCTQGSSLTINQFRLALKERKLDLSEFELYFVKYSANLATHETILVNVDQEGQIKNWPDGLFSEVEEVWLELVDFDYESRVLLSRAIKT
jgi:hypothetical protein